MRELSHHILDLSRNCVEAGATEVELFVAEREHTDELEVRVRDNGRGMEREVVGRVTDAFYTTRLTRKWGFGLPLFAATCERCDGRMEITSAVGEGTTVVGRLKLGHVDRPPLGDMPAVIQALLLEAGRVALRYRHIAPGGVFELDTGELQRQLGDVRLTDPVVVYWVGEFVRGQLRGIGSKA